MVNDVIGDSVTRIRNAFMRGLDSTELYYSRVVVNILDVLKSSHFIRDYRVEDRAGKQKVIVHLSYDDKGVSSINEIRRISKPGRRVYKTRSELRRFKNGYGVIVVSTSRGVVTNEVAYSLNVGGEALCSVW